MDIRGSGLLEKWHRVVFQKDFKALDELISGEITLYSPFVFKPKRSKEETMFVLTNVIEVLQNFKYHRELIEGNNMALEFEATIGELSAKGIDLIEFNEQGQIINFEVFIRPASALMALGQEMNKRFEAAGLPVGKSKHF